MYHPVIPKKNSFGFGRESNLRVGFSQMDDYPYGVVGADNCLYTDGLHHTGFPRLLWRTLQQHGYVKTPIYKGRAYKEYEIEHYEVQVEISHNPVHPDWAPWTTEARGNDMNNAIDKAALQALTEFTERHIKEEMEPSMPLYPIRDQGSSHWQRKMKEICNYMYPTFRSDRAFAAQYAQNLYNVHHEEEILIRLQRTRLGEYAREKDALNQQLQAKTRDISELVTQRGTLQQQVQN